MKPNIKIAVLKAFIILKAVPNSKTLYYKWAILSSFTTKVLNFP